MFITASFWAKHESTQDGKEANARLHSAYLKVLADDAHKRGVHVMPKSIEEDIQEYITMKLDDPGKETRKAWDKATEECKICQDSSTVRKKRRVCVE
jgi:hypothetical protein